MRKKVDTRFPVGRIKKIMQADEEVGKIAMAVPVLISKALEHFLKDLCDRTYGVTLKKGAKTVNSHHLKVCIGTHYMFDFLKEHVAHVPDFEVEADGGSVTGRRRKLAEADNDDGCEDGVMKRSRSDSSSSRERGGRRHGRGRRRNHETARNGNVEDNEASSSSSPHFSEVGSNCTNCCEGETRVAAQSPERHTRCPKDFDLNVELNENAEAASLDKALEQDLQFFGTGLLLGHSQNVYQPEDDYDAEDE